LARRDADDHGRHIGPRGRLNEADEPDVVVLVTARLLAPRQVAGLGVGRFSGTVSFTGLDLPGSGS
jgi:hypothetical protein